MTARGCRFTAWLNSGAKIHYADIPAVGSPTARWSFFPRSIAGRCGGGWMPSFLPIKDGYFTICAMILNSRISDLPMVSGSCSGAPPATAGSPSPGARRPSNCIFDWNPNDSTRRIYRDDVAPARRYVCYHGNFWMRLTAALELGRTANFNA